jgi:RNA polymerase sigma factor (sigma-70 family)
MPASVMNGFLDRVRAAVGPGDDSRSDAQLLAAFADRREADAFAVLVRRYGPLVWAVCRRVAADPHAAEDAFQATFLVLARKAGAVRPRHSAGGWLHRTATHVALKARTMTDRRTRRERPPGAGPEPVVPDAAELIEPAALAALDEEIARLPDGLRAAVVLCELQGVPRRAAAAWLGVAEGTLSSRLAAARKRLADRLRKRGFAPVGGVAGLLAAGSAAGAGVPPALVAAAAAQGTGGGPPVPAAVSVLADGEIRIMYLTKLTSAVALVGVLIAAAFGFSPAVPTAAADPPVVRTARLRAPAQPREGVIVLTSFQPGPSAELHQPSGEAIGQPAVGSAASPINPGGEPMCPLWRPRLSRDGTRLVAVKLGPIPQNNIGPWTPNHL